MSNLVMMDICRVCMDDRTTRLVPIFNRLGDAFIANLLVEFTSVKITENDGLPMTVCQTCVDQLKQFVGFINKARESDQKLRNIVKTEVCISPTEAPEIEQKVLQMMFVEDFAVKREIESVDEENLLKEQEKSFRREESEPDEEPNFSDGSDSDWIIEKGRRKSKRDSSSDDSDSQSDEGRNVKRVRKGGRPSRKKKLGPLDETEMATFKIIELTEGQVFCCGCFQTFDSQEDLQAHARKKHVRGQWTIQKSHKCEVCFSRYTMPYALKMHIRRAQEATKIYHCIKCGIRLIDRKLLGPHAHNHPKSKEMVSSEVIVAPIPVAVQEKFGLMCCSYNCFLPFETEELLIAHAHTVHRVNQLEQSVDPNKKEKQFECPICFTRCISEFALRKHQQRAYGKNGISLRDRKELPTEKVSRQDDSEKFFECEFCTKSFPTIRKFKSHMKIHDDVLDETELATFKIVEIKEEQSICCSCFLLFDSQEDLQAHVQNKHSKQLANSSKPNKCNVCYKTYTMPYQLKMHIRRATRATKVFHCTRCPARIIERELIRQHAHNHPQEKDFISSEILVAAIPVGVQKEYGLICCGQACYKSFETEELLIEHAHTVHKITKLEQSLDDDQKNKPFECSVCFKRFVDQKSLRKHQQRGYVRFSQCSICGLKLRGRKALLAHEESHHDTKPCVCNICHKSLTSKGTLKSHMMIHTGEKPFICPTCGYGFRQKNNLQKHLLSHSDFQPFQCEVCLKRFKAKTHLQYHMRTHTGEKPYPCRHCDKAFANYTNRMRHEVMHTGIKPYKCNYCDKTFLRKPAQEHHESTHTG